MSLPQEPILVIAYNDASRSIMAKEVAQNGLSAVTCSTFAEAEELALQGSYCGLLIDLPAIVKAKGEEKIIACTLASFFPTLRVRVIGVMLIPMTLAGDARQDNSLKEFLEKSCTRFTPRRLRMHRRRQLCLPTLLMLDNQKQRGCTLDISWGGAFVSNDYPEQFSIGNQYDLTFHGAEVTVRVTVRWIRLWGERHIPGIGVSFDTVDQGLAQVLHTLLKSDPELDRDRLSA